MTAGGPGPGGTLKVWRRSWYGRLLHFYPGPSNYKTVCGRTLRGHGEEPMPERVWPQCGRCDFLVRAGKGDVTLSIGGTGSRKEGGDVHSADL